MGTRKKGIFAGLILTGLVVAFPGSTLAFITTTTNTAGGGSCVDEYVHPAASGAKISGTLNLDYVFAGNVTCESGESKPGYFLVYTMRVEKGTTLYFFDGTSTEPICVSDCEKTMQILEEFVNQIVAPFVYPSLYPSLASPKKPPVTAVLKSTTKEVGAIAGTASGPPAGFPWLMLDFEYAVQ